MKHFSSGKKYVLKMTKEKLQHGCTAVTLNGRPGVVVSGGVDGNQFNTTR